MTEPDDELGQQGRRRDISRARQRKLNRANQPGVGSVDATGAKRRRSTNRTGPSVREKLVSTQIKILAPSMKDFEHQSGVNNKRSDRQSAAEQSIRKAGLSKPTMDTKIPRRKAESRRTENLYESSSRTETQRRTETDRPFIAKKNRRVYDVRSEASPPVMVRGGMNGMVFGRSASSRLHKQRTPKRRFDVPLKVQGAEVRLPSLPLFHLGWRSISLSMVIMMLISLILIWKAPVFQVKTVEADGIKRLTVSDLNVVIGSIGASVFTLDPNLLENNLQKAFPELSKISVRVGLPASVKVKVIERIPVISWTHEGTEVWLDKDGIAFIPRGNSENPLVRVEGHGTPPAINTGSAADTIQAILPGTPIATNIPNIRLTPDLVTSILALGAKMPPDTLVLYDSEHGLGWNDPNGWEVYFGAEDEDMEMKLRVYETLVADLQQQGIQPALISVEYVHAPYYRMER